MIGIERDRDSDRRAWLAVVGLLLPVHTLLLAWIACRYSPTSDEVAHFAAGLRALTAGDFRLYTVNPPLPKMLSAIPVLFDNPALRWKYLDDSPAVRKEWNVGQELMWANGQRSLWHYVLARWASIPWSWPGLLICFLWSSELYGNRAGLSAATLWAFSPAVLGNAALITPDVPSASMGLATVYIFRQYLRAPTWRGAMISGLCLGIAELTKMTLLLLYPLLGLLTVIALWLQPKAERNTRRRLAEYAVCVCVSLVVLNAGYLFHGTGRRLADREFFSESLGGVREDWNAPGNRFRGTWLGQIPVPLPTSYLTGVDIQKRDFEGHWRPLYSYMRGHQQIGGWWYFYLYGLLVKVPLGSWLLALAAVASLDFRWREIKSERWRELACLWLPPILLFLFISSQTGFSRPYRYVLPAAPFVMIGLSRVFAPEVRLRDRGLVRIATVGLISMVVASLWVYPHSLGFYNALAGGPANGHWCLLDSNTDWGQDLFNLRDWVIRHPERRPLFVSYSGAFDPHVMGIPGEPPPRRTAEGPPRLAPGWYAVSVNHVHGYDDPDTPFNYFLDRTPVDRAGYSILIYEVTEANP